MSSKDLTVEYKEKKKLAKRIIKAVQGPLEDAMRKESEICQKPFEKELRDLDLLLENSLLSRHDSLMGSVAGDASDAEADDLKRSVKNCNKSKSRDGSNVGNHEELAATTLDEQNDNSGSAGHIEPIPAILNSTSQHLKGVESAAMQINGTDPVSTKPVAVHQHPTPEDSNNTPPMLNGEITHDQRPNGVAHGSTSAQPGRGVQHVEPPTPPLSSGGDLQPLSNGGIPWYMDPFDPEGTTVQEERWTGRELVRGMSEELSDMDEEELSGLVDGDVADTTQGLGTATLTPDAVKVAASRRKAAAKRKRWRGYR